MAEKYSGAAGQRTLERTLKPNTRLDLIVDMDMVGGHIDVRSAMALELDAQGVLAMQPDPPLLKSMVGRAVEATFVSRDPVSSTVIRLGWQGRILDMNNQHKLREEDEKTVSVFHLSRPDSGVLVETNARMDYRLTVGAGDRVTLQTHPSFGRITLLDFSAGGALVLVPAPAPSQAPLGMELWFTLSFPGYSQQNFSPVNGEAEIVRISHNPGDKLAQVGLRFKNMDLTASRTLQKAVNFLMMEEQRARSSRLG